MNLALKSALATERKSHEASERKKETTRARYRTSLATIRARHKHELAQLRATHQLEALALRDRHRSEVERMKTRHKRELANATAVTSLLRRAARKAKP